VAKTYNTEDEPQLLNELKATRIKVGLLVNFGRTKVEWLQPPLRATAHYAVCPSWRTMTGFAGEDDREAGSRVEH
jgi:hypothetical protein